MGTVYRPNTPPKADMDIFTSTRNELMNIIYSEKKQCIIMGDMNVDLLKYGSHEATNIYLDMLFSNGFIPVITKPTRISSTSATLIDHMYYNDINTKYESGIIINDVADHYGTFIRIRNSTTKSSNEPTERRCLNTKNIAKFIELLEKCDFSEIYRHSDTIISYDSFMQKYKNIVDSSFPVKVIKQKKSHEPWLTEDFMKASRLKTKLYRLKQNKPTAENIQKYKTFNNEFNKSKRDAKTMYYNKILNENKTNMNFFFS